MKKIIGIFVLTVILVSCGGNKENRPLNEYVSAFLNENKTIVAFGKADLNSIMNKSEIKDVPKFGMITQKYLEEIKTSIKTETPIYFALEGPFLEDGTPASTYLFFEVQNADSLSGNLSEQGFDLEESGDFEYMESGDVCFGIRNNLAILITKKEEFDGKKLLKDAFDKVKDDVSEGKANEILNAEGDVVMGMSVENLFSTSNTDLKELSKDKQKSLNEMVAGSFIQTTLKFEKGAAVVETKNYFSDKLKSKMFFRKDPSAKIVSNLGQGKPVLGVALNIDMMKLQSFMDEYSPRAMRDLTEMMGGEFQMALAMGGKKGLAGLFSGDFGMVMVGEPNAVEGMSDFNFYLGLGKSGHQLAESFKDMLSFGMAKVDLSDKGLSASSSLVYAPEPGKKLMIPQGCEVFGKKGITAFMNFEGVDLSAFEFEDEAEIIYLIKYVTFEMDENGSKLYIKAKEGKENILKQAVDVLVEQLSGKIGEMMM